MPKRVACDGQAKRHMVGLTYQPISPPAHLSTYMPILSFTGSMGVMCSSQAMRGIIKDVVEVVRHGPNTKSLAKTIH